MKEFPYGVRGPAEAPDVADALLAGYFNVLDRLGIKGAVILGCCLGLYRDGAYLVGDNDIDVAAIVTKWGREAVCAALISTGYLQGRSFANANNTHFLHFEGNMLLDVSWRDENYYSAFENIRYKDRDYPAPSPIEAYLERCYGPKWRVNDPDNDGVVLAG